jgi:hypothetical protein
MRKYLSFSGSMNLRCHDNDYGGGGGGGHF